MQTSLFQKTRISFTFISITLAVTACFLFSCKSEDNLKSCQLFPINPSIKIIGHKGSGVYNKFGNKGLEENTFPAVVNVMEKLDGSEIDIGISADSTLWVYHNFTIENCNDSTVPFFSLTDNELKKISACRFDQQLITLHEFMSRSQKEKWDGKILDLDLKLTFNPFFTKGFKSPKELTIWIASKLQETVHDTPFHLIYEVYKPEQYSYFSTIFGKEHVYLAHADSSLIAQAKSNTIHFSLSLTTMKENKIQAPPASNLWVVCTPQELLEGTRLQPSILQGDNIPLLTLYKKLQTNAAQLACSPVEKKEIHSNKEFINLIHLEKGNVKQQIIELQFEQPLPPGAILTYSVQDKENKNLLWRELSLNDSLATYIFINPSFFNHLKFNEANITIWNREKQSIQQSVTKEFYNIREYVPIAHIRTK